MTVIKNASWQIFSLLPLLAFRILLMTKDFKASKLWFFMFLSFPLLCHGFQITLLNLRLLWWSIINKNTKTYTKWLEMIANVLNMLIGLKGNKYYSKVFKRVNYKLSNSTFWVVISTGEGFGRVPRNGGIWASTGEGSGWVPVKGSGKYQKMVESGQVPEKGLGEYRRRVRASTGEESKRLPKKGSG